MATSIILVVISLVIVLVVVKLLSDIRKISNHGIEVKGIIFNSEQLVRPDNNISYPVVRFLTMENNWITKSSKIGVIPGLYKIGKEVTVIYQNGNPHNFFIKDKLTFLIPLGMLIAASILATFGIIFLIHI